ncbi:helix-turn-helix domain-containing protein [Psychrobacter lutiphocae]|uniref:helix-turn-helix domain-containing protein n=1 Tax=Psychrobacter lutiphocae TaxID=540500 RepID=UPI0003652F93|nr:helix-turn-helix domain-containing protein [Psychrobacter lutiphocae]
MLRKKNWSEYTNDEKELLKQKVAEADENTPFSPEFAAAYIGKSLHTLQHMRCHQSNGITYSKVGRHVMYRKKHLDAYLDSCEKSCTSN